MLNLTDPGLVTTTTDIDKFATAIGALKAGGRSDCNEPTFGPIIRALENSVRRSAIYVFTDAPASDEGRLAEAQSLIAEKDIEVNFVLTPGCTRKKQLTKDTRYTGRALYHYLAAYSGGQVLEVEENEVTAVTRLVSTSARRTHATILRRASPRGFTGTLRFPVDDTVEELVMIVSSDSHYVKITTPSGETHVRVCMYRA